MEMAFAVTAMGTLVIAAVAIMNMRIVRSSANNANLPVVVAHELHEPASDLAVHRLRWERTKRALTTPPHIRPRALRR